MKNLRYRLGVVVVVVLTIAAALNMGCERCDRVSQEEGERLLNLYGDTQPMQPLSEDVTAASAPTVVLLETSGATAHDKHMAEQLLEAWKAGAAKADEPDDEAAQNYEDNDDHALTGDEEVKAEVKEVEKSAPTPKLKDLLVSITVKPMVGAYIEQLVQSLRRAESACSSGEQDDMVTCANTEKLAITYGWFSTRSVWFRDIMDHQQIRKHLSERVDPDDLGEHQYNIWRKAAMEAARKYFANPKNVKVQYKQFKAQALATLKQELTTQQLEQVKTLLASYAEIYFAEYEKIPQDLQNAAGSEEKSYELLNQGPSCTEEEADQLSVVRNSAAALLKGRVSSPETFHFARRRYHEGGQPLLNAYAWCLNDLAAAIK